MNIRIVKNTIGTGLQLFEDKITGIDLSESIANIGLADISAHFLKEEDSRGKKWERLSPITVEKRRKKTDIPLRDTGQMFMSLNIGLTNTKMAVVSLNKYDQMFGINVPKLQNEGGTGYVLEDDGSVKEIIVPDREFMYLSQGAITEISGLAPGIAAEVAREN